MDAGTKTNDRADQAPDLPSLCHAMFEGSPMPVATVAGAKHIVCYANPVFCSLVGKSKSELIGNPFAEMVPGDGCLSLLAQVYRTGKAETHTEPEHAEAHPVYWSYAMWPVLGADERPVGVMIQVTETARFHQQATAMNQELLLSVVRQHELTEVEERLNAQLHLEITERKRVEQEAVAAKELAQKTVAQFRANIDSMSEGMYVIGADGKRLLTNPAYFRIHSFEPAPPEEFASSISALLERYDLNGGLLSPEEWPVSRALRGETVLHSQQRVRRIDTGHEVILSVNAVPVRDGAGNLTLAVVTIEDITTQKQSEAALIRSEKLASVGRMAATIAHEINNPLAAVMNLLFIAKSLKDLPESACQYLDMADAELKRIAHITRQSLGFYRESTAPALTSVNAVLESAVDLLKSRIKTKRAVIEKQWDKDVEVTAVAGELRQVFSNLLANSLDAIDEKGLIKLRVSTGAAVNDGHRCVRITVADNGKGISASLRQHIFEPFFTTKGTVGTGLGLWVSKQIIDKHGGTIRVRSGSNGARRGAVFSIVLPIEPAVATSSQAGGA